MRIAAGARRVLAAGSLCLSACARLGPDFHASHEDWVEHWNSPAIEQLSARVDGQGDAERAAQWWKVFADPTLERLIADADAHNASLKIAGLRVMEARAQLGIAQSGRYPQLQQVSADALRVDRRQAGGRNPENSQFWQYSAGFDIGWELDFWGRFSRAIESADAAYFAAVANHDDAMVLVRAQVADTYFAMRTAEARLRIARDNAKLQRRSYEITERLFKGGETDELDVQQARTQYLGTASSIPEIEAQIVRARNAIATLTGRPPSPAAPYDLDPPGTEGVIPLIDRVVLQDVPANLLLRRPDIRAAELQVAAQSARIGVAMADLYPSLSLLGSIGWSATSFAGTPNSFIMLGGPSLRWNVFDHGRIRNAVRVEDARLQQLIVSYEDAVRQAAREADDAATGLVKALEREVILRDAQASAARSFTLASTLYREGFTDFQRVLDAQRALFAQQDAYLVNRSNAVGNLIALYKALGGGWYSDRPLVDTATRRQMEQRTNWGNLLDEQTRPAKGDRDE